MEAEITFKGEMHTIPRGAVLVLKVDRILTAQQAEHIQQHCLQVLGEDYRVLVLGPEFTVVPTGHEKLSIIEAKLDTLIAALAEEDDEPLELDLEGQPAGAQRDQSQSLG